jgi:dihydropteroate synthase
MPFAVRRKFDWRLRTRSLALGTRTLIMGILNATPDSFSDGGQYLDPCAALTHALQMLDEGADILDIGGESTRPNSTPITPAEEQSRVLPILRAILAARPKAVVSIDTYHSETARLAIDFGAEIVNDVSGFLWDDAMAATCAELKCGVILMHTRGRPQQWRTLPALAPAEVTPLILRELNDRALAALAAGIARETIVLDPGFGFGKILDENFPLLAHFDRLHALGFPLLAGLSRKGFLRRTLIPADQPQSQPASTQHTQLLDTPHSFHAQDSVHETDSLHAVQNAITAANTAVILSGAHILRIHDVRPAREAAAIADQILAAGGD